MRVSVDSFGDPATFPIEVGDQVVTTYTYNWATGIFHLNARESVASLTLEGTRQIQNAVTTWLDDIRQKTSFVYSPTAFKSILDQDAATIRAKLSFGQLVAVDVTFFLETSLCVYQGRGALDLSISQFRVFIDTHVGFYNAAKKYSLL